MESEDHVTGTKLVIRLLFSSELQCRITFTGSGTGIVFALNHTMILSLIKDTIIDFFPGVVGIQVKNVIQNYLKRSADRKGGLPRLQKRRLGILN